MLDKTTMKDVKKSYILGRQDTGVVTFTFNYNEEDYKKVVAVCDADKEFLVVLPDGTGTYIAGMGTVYRNEMAVNGIIEATLSIAPSEITFKDSTEVEELLATA